MFLYASIRFLSFMNYYILLGGIVGFLTTFFAIKWFIRYARLIGLEVKDQNKENKPLVPLSGGICVMAGLLISLTLFIFLNTFLGDGTFIKEGDLTFLFAALVSIIIITFIGFTDDLLIRRDKESSAGLKQWQKPILTLVAAIPLIVVNAGSTAMSFPFFGRVDIGLLYPLLLVPIGVVGAANMVN